MPSATVLPAWVFPPISTMVLPRPVSMILTVVIITAVIPVVVLRVITRVIPWVLITAGILPWVMLRGEITCVVRIFPLVSGAIFGVPSRGIHQAIHMVVTRMAHRARRWILPARADEWKQTRLALHKIKVGNLACRGVPCTPTHGSSANRRLEQTHTQNKDSTRAPNAAPPGGGGEVGTQIGPKRRSSGVSRV